MPIASVTSFKSSQQYGTDMAHVSSHQDLWCKRFGHSSQSLFWKIRQDICLCNRWHDIFWKTTPSPLLSVLLWMSDAYMWHRFEDMVSIDMLHGNDCEIWRASIAGNFSRCMQVVFLTYPYVSQEDLQLQAVGCTGLPRESSSTTPKDTHKKKADRAFWCSPHFRWEEAGEIIMHQRSYIECCFFGRPMIWFWWRALTTYQQLVRNNPADPYNEEGYPASFEQDKSPCQEYIGQLMWWTIRTRPDVTATSGILASQWWSGLDMQKVVFSSLEVCLWHTTSLYEFIWTKVNGWHSARWFSNVYVDVSFSTKEASVLDKPHEFATRCVKKVDGYLMDTGFLSPCAHTHIYIYRLWSYCLGQVWPFEVLLSGPSRCYYLGQVVFAYKNSGFKRFWAHTVIILCFFCAQLSGNFLK